MIIRDKEDQCMYAILVGCLTPIFLITVWVIVWAFINMPYLLIAALGGILYVSIVYKFLGKFRRNR